VKYSNYKPASANVKYSKEDIEDEDMVYHRTEDKFETIEKESNYKFIF